jgi:hypothetical protein
VILPPIPASRRQLCPLVELTNQPRIAIEQLARAIHQGYVRRRIAEGVAQNDPSLAPWESLRDELKNSNLDQARSVEQKLTAIGCVISPGNSRFQFTDSELEFLSELEHERWVRERLDGGWKLARKKDVEQKLTPYLVPWSELDEPARDLDREVVLAIPHLLHDAGFTIRRRFEGGVTKWAGI